MSKLALDLTDLAIHFCSNSEVTGIQRYQLRISYFLVDNFNSVGFSLIGGTYVDLTQHILESAGDPTAFATLIKNTYRIRIENIDKNISRHIIIRKIYSLLNLISMYKRISYNRIKSLEAGDFIVVSGAFWVMPSLLFFYKKLTKRQIFLISVIHDVIPITHPQYSDDNHAKCLIKLLRLNPFIIASSYYTKTQITEIISNNCLPRLSRDVAVVQLASEFRGYTRDQVTSPVRCLKFKRPYILCVGTICARKNQLFLAAVWKEIQRDLGEEELPDLVLAGNLDNKVKQEIMNYIDTRTLLWIDRPTDSEIAELYKGCLFTVFPSLAEGWGLPVGESLWFGKACAASNVQSIPEVGGESCNYFDPRNAESIKFAINQLLNAEIRKTKEENIRKKKLRNWDEVGIDMVKTITKEKFAKQELRTMLDIENSN